MTDLPAAPWQHQKSVPRFFGGVGCVHQWLFDRSQAMPLLEGPLVWIGQLKRKGKSAQSAILRPQPKEMARTRGIFPNTGQSIIEFAYSAAAVDL